MTVRPSETFDGPSPPGLPDVLTLSLRALEGIIAKQQEAVIELRQVMTRLSLERAEACRMLRKAVSAIVTLEAARGLERADEEDPGILGEIGAFLRRVEPGGGPR